MKQQFIIATVAYALSSTGFAATTGSHSINLTVNAPTSQLILVGSLFGISTGFPYGGTFTPTITNLIWDNAHNITTNADNTQNLRFDNIGSVGVVAEGYPTNQTGKCVLTATGDWTLSGGDTSLKYGLYSGVDTIVFGFTNQTDTVEKGEDPNDPAIWRWFANGRCQSFISLNLQINGATRPSSLAPINGVTPARVLTDVINFTVQVI